MATLIQRTSEAKRPQKAHRKLSDQSLPVRHGLKATPRSGGLRGALRTIAHAMLAPFLFTAGLLGFVWVMADLTWYRMRSLGKSRSRPRGLWDI